RGPDCSSTNRGTLSRARRGGAPIRAMIAASTRRANGLRDVPAHAVAVGPHLPGDLLARSRGGPGRRGAGVPQRLAGRASLLDVRVPVAPRPARDVHRGEDDQAAGGHGRHRRAPPPSPKRHPPIWITAQSPDSLEAAVRRGFNVLTGGFGVSIERLAEFRRLFDKAVAEVTPPHPLQIGVQRAVYVADSVADARAA